MVRFFVDRFSGTGKVNRFSGLDRFVFGGCALTDNRGRLYLVERGQSSQKSKGLLMTTKVSQTYTPSLNLSMTTKNGEVTRITTWTTGVPGSSEVVFLSPGLKSKASAATVLRKARKR